MEDTSDSYLCEPFLLVQEGEDCARYEELPFLAYVSGNESADIDNLEQLKEAAATSEAAIKVVDGEEIVDVSSNMPNSKFTNGRYKTSHRPVGNYPSINSPALMSPECHLKTTDNNSAKKERTPNTVLRMMERHRENERVRHHTLNESMRSVCQQVPGFEDSLKETKVVMMQRIIGYIFYLENTIKALCNDLHIRLNFSTSFISNNWNRDSGNESEDELPSAGIRQRLYIPVSPMKQKQFVARKHVRRKKISSPTVDSTTDSLRESQWSYNGKSTVTSSQDSNVPAPSCIPFSSDSLFQSPIYNEDSDTENEPLHDDMNTLLQYSNIYDEATSLRLPSPTFIKEDDHPTSTISLDLLSSPSRDVDKESLWLGSRSTRQAVICLENNMDIECDSSFSGAMIDIHDANMTTISPDSVLPTKFFPINCHGSTDTYEECNVMDHKLKEMDRMALQMRNSTKLHKTPVKSLKNKRKQYTPVAKRSPFQNITNWVTRPTEDKSVEAVLGPLQKKAKIVLPPLPGKVIKKGNEKYQSFVPYIWNFHKSAVTRRQKVEADKLQQNSPEARIEKEPQTVSNTNKAIKIDHRKTTWMNGFMMFSRLNRRMFIDANPGVHTSHISKMMGHAWRNMPEQEQQPYKDKAKDFTSGIKSRDFPDFSVSSRDTSNDCMNMSIDRSGEMQNKSHQNPGSDR